ncbi:TIGR03620 family F420-dependent LLM class oxidoreductase [Trujillonella endophytica]|uniref:Probable F420-dependent oxidoreductase, MSMEG_4141 family n=1 Tax=Trujillonella endophytica TaxID=673521 RepID=A0A1H8T6W3_9ACTN|nr:TIGR03620 family F420-dependent LLM class oxidoreductase [Trujillella endophytica]SEO86662.1 probable F420-dependent oxidoreductase, MSMEG_4141 family [Trujillella endophytica]
MVPEVRARFGRFGVWHMGAPSPELAQVLERLGYGALWVGGSPAGDLRAVEDLLDATTTLTLATGIVNVWDTDAGEVARSFDRIESRHPGRFVLGVGIGHREANREYRSPFETLSSYVDSLRASGVPADRLVLAALGSRALRLAAERSAGAHPYFVPIEHTRGARDVVGPTALLAPEHKVVVDPDPERARAVARRLVTGYSRLANYRNNLRRLGWSEEDLAAVSDELVDALVAHGSPDDVARRLAGHLDAGADHVALHLLTHEGEDPLDTYTLLAGALGLSRG